MFVQVTNPIQDENHFTLNKDMVSEISTSVVCRTVVNRIIPKEQHHDDLDVMRDLGAS